MKSYIDTSDDVERVTLVDGEGLILRVVRQEKQAFVRDLDAFDERTTAQLDGIKTCLLYTSRPSI